MGPLAARLALVALLAVTVAGGTVAAGPAVASPPASDGCLTDAVPDHEAIEPARTLDPVAYPDEWSNADGETLASFLADFEAAYFTNRLLADGVEPSDVFVESGSATVDRRAGGCTVEFDVYTAIYSGEGSMHGDGCHHVAYYVTDDVLRRTEGDGSPLRGRVLVDCRRNPPDRAADRGDRS